MTKKLIETLATVGKRLTALQATYATKTAQARTALIGGAALVFEVDNRKNAWSGDDGVPLVGKPETDARGAWYRELGLEPWFVNLARSLSNAVALMGSVWVEQQSNETIKRLAPEINAKHKSGKSKGKPLSAAKRKTLVKERLIAAMAIANERDADTPSGDDISKSRGDGRDGGKSLAWIAKRGLEVDTSKTGTINLEEWQAFVTMVTNGSATIAAKLVTDARDAETKATNEETDESATG